MKKILIICGTRPEIIKLAPVYHQLKNENWAKVSWLHTGQHEEMSTSILACFNIVPDITLKRTGTTLAEFSLGCRAQLETVLDSQQWSLVIVQGDTESAFLGALTAFYHRIPIAHVEAGLRTYDLNRPFPEEGLRQMLSRITHFNFPPTEGAKNALLAEAIPAHLIHVTGNTVVDAQKWVIENYHIRAEILDQKQILVTIHRRENWGEEIEEACLAIAEFAQRHAGLSVLFPVHLNPIVKGPVYEILGNLANVSLISPLDYLEMQQAIANSWLILTDSGGIQEEAPTFGVPVLVLRKETERPEAVEAGCAKIIGTSRQAILDNVELLWSDDYLYQSMQSKNNPFGDGHASNRIAGILEKKLV